MPENYRYLRVGLSKISAIIGVSPKNEVKIIFCSNMESCFGFDFGNKICPGYCQLIAEARKYISGDGDLNAEVDELFQESKRSCINFTSLVSYN